ncbi:restriction endonuclease [Halostella litorea]|uniref:restriction endonuclease n=1 Tax=Halostella litorea TaxID=2528831 RepID=UPI001387618F|nr:restriction endonuclease [Halostella litorea]
MDEYDFEELVADIWAERGWQTTVTTGSSDRGIDVIARKQSPFRQKQLIQAKRYAADNKIGSPDIQQYSSLKRQEDDVDAVIVITTSSFTSQAERTANDLNVKLIDGPDLADVIADLDSDGIVSAYFGDQTKTPRSSSATTTDKSEGSSTDQNSRASRSATSSTDATGSSTSADPSALPDRFEKDERTTKLGKSCPYCSSYRSIWKGKTANTDPLLVCEDCGTKWVKKTGIIASTKWNALGKDEKKTASEWKS